ncbi:MAG: hypothetical protein HGA25_09820, partial [Clostridiales bacterium]|nr:hypothetical protein [Clostridiales bacterium]
MKKTLLAWKEFYKRNRTWITYLMGFLVVSFSIVPYLYLKENIWISIHDNLDAEILNYIYNAKYLFSDSKVIPEVMNGIPREWYEAPAPLLVLFYKLFSPFYAYTAAQYFVIVCGYTGLFFLIHEITHYEDEISFVVAGIFCYLPFYNIYGLTILGQALVAYAFLNLYQGKKKIVSLALICLYVSASSLALAGYALIGVTILVEFWIVLRGKWRSKIDFLIGIGVFILTSCLFNMGLIKGVLGIGESAVSHRTEFVQYGTDFWTQFKTLFFEGEFYTTACNRYIVYACLGMAGIKIVSLVIQKIRKKEIQLQHKEIHITIVILFLANTCICL